MQKRGKETSLKTNKYNFTCVRANEHTPLKTICHSVEDVKISDWQMLKDWIKRSDPISFENNLWQQCRSWSHPPGAWLDLLELWDQWPDQKSDLQSVWTVASRAPWLGKLDKEPAVRNQGFQDLNTAIAALFYTRSNCITNPPHKALKIERSKCSKQIAT